MNSFYDDIGIRIRGLREMNQYTRETFAEIADISPKFLYEIETGKKGFSADTLHRIATGLGVSCEYILSGRNDDAVNAELMENLQLFNGVQLSRLASLLKTIYEISTLK